MMAPMRASKQSAARTRRSLIDQIAAITTMQPGTLAEEYRERPDPNGTGVLRLGPYFKYQCWKDGRNVSRRVPADEAGQLREDIENGKRFTQLTNDLAQVNISQTLALRATETVASEQALVAKKNSANKHVSKGSAKRSASSTKPKRG